MDRRHLEQQLGLQFLFQPSGDAIEQAVQDGRGGLGTVIVFAAGNERLDGQDVNYHGFQNSRHTIAVAATDQNGENSYFSTPGAALLVAAPGSGIATTDRTGADGYVGGDYVFMSGTSFASPIVAGVAGLMIEANPDLGHRDVQEILAYSARQVDVADPGWAINGAADWNGGGLHVSHDYGYGLIDAHAAVRLAETWERSSTWWNEQVVSGASTVQLGIPDSVVAGVSDTIGIASGLRIDQVEVDLDLSHTWIGDLTVTLTSPAGTESLLVNRPGVRAGDPFGTWQDDIHFTLSSTQYWSENGIGDWTLTVADELILETGRFDGWSLSLYGDLITDDDTYIFTNEFANFTGAGDAGRRLLGDAAGIDTLNAAAITAASTIDLTPGGTSTLAGNTLTIDATTLIENVLLGDGDDDVTGNAADNRLRGGRGDDVLRGGDGTDVAVFTGALAEYDIATGGSFTTVTHVSPSGVNDGIDHLWDIEILQFADTTVGVTPNNAPTALWLAGGAVDENTVGAAVGTLGVSDPDVGDTHVFAVADARFEVVGAELRLKAGESLDHESTASVTVAVTATDAGGLAITEDVTITVTDLNEAPIAITLAGGAVDENAAGAVIGTLSVSDPDDGTEPYGQHTLSVSDARFEVVGAELRLKAGQSLDHESAASVTVAVTATDAGGLALTEAVAIAVTDLNEAPVAVADGVTIDGGGPAVILAASLLANDSDADGDVLSLASVGGAVGGTVALDGAGDVVFTPVAGFAGGGFTYTVSDGAGGGASAEVTVSPAPTGTRPDGVAGLNLWLDASDAASVVDLGGDGDVDQWLDGSGAGNDASQGGAAAQPLIAAGAMGGLTALSFDGADDVLAVANAVDLNTGGPYGGKTLMVAFETGADVTSRQVIYEQGAHIRGLNIYLDGGEIHIGGWNLRETTWGPGYASAAVAADTAYVATLVHDSAATTLTGYLDGAEIGVLGGVADLYKHSGAIGFGAMNVGAYFHDGAATGNGHHFAGLIGEAAFYDRALAAADQTAVENYLTAKWAQGAGPSAASAGDPDSFVFAPDAANDASPLLDDILVRTPTTEEWRYIDDDDALRLADSGETDVIGVGLTVDGDFLF